MMDVPELAKEIVADVEHEHDPATFIALIGIACFGGVVQWIRNPPRTVATFVTSSITAAFVGLMAHFVMTWLNIDMSLQFAIAGAAGYSGGVVVDTLVPKFIAAILNRAERR